MITFTTETGSVYEADMPQRRIRRLSGPADPTPRQGPDGQWKQFDSITWIDTGLPVTIIWSSSITGDGDRVLHTTITSPVREVSDD